MEAGIAKFVISVLCRDRPGIIARVSRALLELECNIENVSQTILQTEFSGIFIVAAPELLSAEILSAKLHDKTRDMGLHFYVKRLNAPDEKVGKASEPFVITTRGPDRKGLVAGVTEVIAGFGANVTNLQALFAGGDDPSKNVMMYEVDVPMEIDQRELDAALRKKAADLGLEISIQHRNIFEAIHRI